MDYLRHAHRSRRASQRVRRQKAQGFASGTISSCAVLLPATTRERSIEKLLRRGILGATIAYLKTRIFNSSGGPGKEREERQPLNGRDITRRAWGETHDDLVVPTSVSPGKRNEKAYARTPHPHCTRSTTQHQKHCAWRLGPLVPPFFLCHLSPIKLFAIGFLFGVGVHVGGLRVCSTCAGVSVFNTSGSESPRSVQYWL